MSVLSPLEIAAYARQAGFPDDTLVTMTAGALAESGGNPFAHNNNPATGDNSKGLLQVNMRGALGPDRRKRFGLASDDELFNPATNMRVAKGIFDSQGLGAWGAIRTGAYKKFLPQAQDAVARLLGGEVPDLGRSFSAAAPVAGSAGALQQLAQSILEGNLDSASRPTASDPLARIAQAGLVDPFAPRPVRMAASGDFFEVMAGLSGGLTEPVAAAVRSVMGGGAPANNIRPLDATMSAMASSGDLIDAGRVIDFRRDPLPSTGDHLDVRVVGPDGKYRNPANEQALLSRLLVGENPLYVDGRSAFPLTSGFGPRNIGIGSRNHRGADYAVPAGTPLRWRGGGRFTRQNGYGLVETMHNGEPFQIKLLHTTG